MYRFADPISGHPVWRFDPGTWNGQKPKESKPLYTHPAPQVAVPEGWRHALEEALAMMTSQSMTLERQADAVTGIRDLLAAAPEQPVSDPNDPIPTILHCPQCNSLHVDEGEWKTRPHKTHQCQACGHEWRPYSVPTVGIPAPAEREIAALVIEFCEDPNNRVRQTQMQMCALLDALRGDVLRAGKEGE